MTALDILKQKLFEHYRPQFPTDKRTWEVIKLSLITETTEPILAAMREIYELGRNEGEDYAQNMFKSDMPRKDGETRLKELFPEK